MGLDLKIIPTYRNGSNFSCSALECDRDYNLFDQVKFIQEKHGIDVPKKGVRAHFGDEYSQENEDAYGDRLQIVEAKYFKSVDLFYDSPTNRAVLAYIKALNEDHEIYLYWH